MNSVINFVLILQEFACAIYCTLENLKTALSCMSDRFLICFFIYYLAALRSALGHHRGDSFTNPMLITALRVDSNFDPKVIRSLVVRLGP